MASELCAGPLSCTYENGFLRTIKHGDREILRMIYFALRDENWGTYPIQIKHEHLQVFDNSFKINYDAFHERDQQLIYHWRVAITGDESGTITFDIKGTALVDILKNRVGFCVLQPLSGVAGAACTILHSNGKVEQSAFPELVAPENPFHDVTALHWTSYGVACELNFKGEVFETEDQRNWTDASFKTFCTPLSIPFPVQLKQGTGVHQRISFYAKPADIEVRDNSVTEVRDSVNHKIQLGVGASTETDLLSDASVQLLRALQLSHYRLEVEPATSRWKEQFRKDCHHARLLQLPLEIVLTLSLEYQKELSSFLEEAKLLAPHIKFILLLGQSKSTPQYIIDECVPQLRSTCVGVKIGGGTNYNFTELNRNRFNSSNLDFISFSIHPQEHAFDDLSILETVESYASVISSARQIYPGKAVHISPLTLRKRFNPNATELSKQKLSNAEKADPRQALDFCAEFTTLALQELHRCGVESVSIFQTAGRQGLLDADTPHPVYHSLLKLRMLF